MAPLRPERVALEGDLETPASLAFQAREWVAERIAWAVMLLIGVAGVLGVLGGGPLAQGRAQSADGAVRVEYERIARLSVSTRVRVHLDVAPAADGVSVALARAWVDAVDLERTTPIAARTEIDPAWTTYTFARSGAPGAVAVTLHVRPERVGLVHGSVRLAGGPTIAFTQLVLP